MKPVNKNENQEILEKAKLALEYFIEKKNEDGAKVKTEWIQSITEFENTISNSQQDSYSSSVIDSKTKITNTISELCDIIHPVTLENLIALEKKYSATNWFTRLLIHKDNRTNISIADFTFNKYKILTLILAIVLFTIQTYWLVGISVMNTYLETQKIIIKAENMNPKNNAEISRLKELNIGNIKVLWDWKKITSIEGFVDLTSDKKFDIERHPEAVLRSSKDKLLFLDSYFLPLLWGLLGAVVYSFIHIPQEIEAKTFTRNSKNYYISRLYLGAIGGFVIGWFIGGHSDETSISLQNLSPLALSFLTGYNIDILFSFLDKLKK